MTQKGAFFPFVLGASCTRDLIADAAPPAQQQVLADAS